MIAECYQEARRLLRMTRSLYWQTFLPSNKNQLMTLWEPFKVVNENFLSGNDKLNVNKKAWCITTVSSKKYSSLDNRLKIKQQSFCMDKYLYWTKPYVTILLKVATKHTSFLDKNLHTWKTTTKKLKAKGAGFFCYYSFGFVFFMCFFPCRHAVCRKSIRSLKITLFRYRSQDPSGHNLHYWCSITLFCLRGKPCGIDCCIHISVGFKSVKMSR